MDRQANNFEHYIFFTVLHHGAHIPGIAMNVAEHLRGEQNERTFETISECKKTKSKLKRVLVFNDHSSNKITWSDDKGAFWQIMFKRI